MGKKIGPDFKDSHPATGSLASACGAYAKWAEALVLILMPGVMTFCNFVCQVDGHQSAVIAIRNGAQLVSAET